MDITITLVGKVLDLTVGPVRRYLGFVFSYSSNIEKLRKQAAKLKATRDDVEGLVVAAQNNNLGVKEAVQNWMCSVSEITEIAEKIFEKESLSNTGCSARSCTKLWLRYKLSKEANQKAAEIGILIEDGKFHHVSQPDCESRVSKMNEVMEALADSTVHAIGLYGLGGVGKTTLARQVAEEASDLKLVGKVIFVEVKHFPVKEIQGQIADRLGLIFNTSDSELERANQLRWRLMQEIFLLIIFDDLWERLDLNQVGIPFAADEAKTQCKLIFTSRNVGLLYSQMNCERIIMIEPLSEGEAWALFKKTAEIDESSDDRNLLSIASEVSQMCARLPVAIVAMARALRYKSLVVWKDALDQLKSYSSRNIPFIEGVDSSIKLSVDFLEGKELKSTFLLSAMFSQEPLIEELFIYAVGLGFLKGVNDMEAARTRLDAMVHQLKASSLLLESYSEDRFKMHDIVRRVALSVAFEEQYALVKRREKVDDWPDEYKPESCAAICLDQSDIVRLPEGLDGPKVEFFFLNSNDAKLNVPNGFFDGMKEVKVLSFSNMTFSSLPSSVCLLNKLATLSLHSCTLEDIALIKHLKQLEILNLSNSSIKQLPCEVGQLSFLKILNLSNCYELKVIPPNILSYLEKLEELYMRNSFDRWEAEGLNESKESVSLDELKNLQKLSTLEIHIPDASVLPKDLFLENSLRRYKISIGRYDDFYDCKFSRTLTLEANNNINMEYGVFKLFKGVEELTLENLNGVASLYQSHNTAQIFSELCAIKVGRCDQLKYLFFASMSEIFHRLERIEVSKCKSFEEIVAFVDEDNVEKGSAKKVIGFHKLHTLKLNDLPALGTHFCFDNKVVFPNLETLIINSINCKNIYDISTPKSNGAHWSKLKTIEVSNCDQLKSLFPIFMVGILSGLESIKIYKCKSLEEIVAFANHENVGKGSAMNLVEFLKLRTLALEDLPALTDSCLNNKVAFPKLETLNLASVGCHNIWDVHTSIGTGTQITEIVESSRMRAVSFSNLKTLKVEKCNFLLKLIPLHIIKSLSNLEELQIEECASLEVIFDLGEFSDYKETHRFSLKTLHLKDLPELKTLCSKGSPVIISSLSLQKLVVENCNKLEADEEQSGRTGNERSGFIEGDLRFWRVQ